MAKKMQAYISLESFSGDGVDGFDMIAALRAAIRALQSSVQSSTGKPLVMSADIEVGEEGDGGKIASILIGDADALDELQARISGAQQLDETARSKPDHS